MIQVKVTRNTDLHITEVIIEGHAGYADSGYDLVCAAVSAVTFGTANAIKALLQTNAVKAVGESGFLHFRIPPLTDPSQQKDVQLLMEAMIIALHTIADSYTDEIQSVSEYIHVIDNL